MIRMNDLIKSSGMEVFLNDKFLATVTYDANEPDIAHEVVFRIPAKLSQSLSYSLSIKALDKAPTPAITDIRCYTGRHFPEFG